MTAMALAALCFAASAAGRGRRDGGNAPQHDQTSRAHAPPPDIQAQLMPILEAADRLFETHQHAQAQVALEQALELWPAEPVARFKLAMLLQQGQRPDLALQHLETAAKHATPRHPMRADIIGALGRLQLHTAKAEQHTVPHRAELLASGVSHLRAALQLRPQLAKADPTQVKLEDMPQKVQSAFSHSHSCPSHPNISMVGLGVPAWQVIAAARRGGVGAQRAAGGATLRRRLGGRQPLGG